MWRVKTVTKFKNSFFPVLIYWNDNRIHLNTFKKSVFVSMVPPLLKVSLFSLYVDCTVFTVSTISTVFKSFTSASSGRLSSIFSFSHTFSCLKSTASLKLKTIHTMHASLSTKPNKPLKKMHLNLNQLHCLESD